MTNEPTQSDSQPEAPASDQPADIDTWDPPADARIVATVDSTFAAKALVAVLADHDINAAAVTHLQQGASIHPGGADYPVRIVVAPSDADRARTVLEDNARDARRHSDCRAARPVCGHRHHLPHDRHGDRHARSVVFSPTEPTASIQHVRVCNDRHESLAHAVEVIAMLPGQLEILDLLVELGQV